jgi:hypothetical protein
MVDHVRPLIIDTDIGSDIDDAIAIAYAMLAGYDCAYLYDPLVVHHNIESEVTSKMNYGKDAVAVDVDKLFKENVLNKLMGVRT